MEPQELVYVLEELHFSADMPRDVLDKLAAESTLRRMPAGTVLFREGSDAADLYLLRTGKIALEMNVPGRGSVRILTIGAGEMVGWSSLLEHGKMTATAVAVEETEVVCAPAVKLHELSEASRDFGFHLMRQMVHALSKRLLATRLQLLDLFADSPPPISADAPEGR